MSSTYTVKKEKVHKTQSCVGAYARSVGMNTA